MPRDHYVAQTYLKHFTSPDIGNCLYVYDKKKQERFTQIPKNVLWEQDWDKNPYFEDEEIKKKLLETIEPEWNQGVYDIGSLLKSEEIKYHMAHYIAVLASCTPAMIRTGTDPLRAYVSVTCDILLRTVLEEPEKYPELKPPYDGFIEDIIEKGGLRPIIDPKYVHYMSVSAILDIAWNFYKSPWMILHNETSSPFLTNDSPVAFYYPKQNTQIPYRYVPISPNFAILIKPSLDIKDKKHPIDLEYLPDTETDIRSIKERFVKILNALTVQGAERWVVSAYDKLWIMKLMKKYKDFQMDSGTVRIPQRDGELIIPRSMPRERRTETVQK